MARNVNLIKAWSLRAFCLCILHIKFRVKGLRQGCEGQGLSVSVLQCRTARTCEGLDMKNKAGTLSKDGHNRRQFKNLATKEAVEADLYELSSPLSTPSMRTCQM